MFYGILRIWVWSLMAALAVWPAAPAAADGTVAAGTVAAGTVAAGTVAAGTAAGGTVAAGTSDFQLGREYVEVPPRLAESGDGRIEVIEFFWYGCPHCYAVEPQVNAWSAKLPPDVRFLRLPAKFNPPTDFHARIFLTLEALGSGPEKHAKVFRVFQEEGRFISDSEALPGLAKDLKMDPQAFVAAFNSPAVQAKMEALDKLMTAYDLPGVPAMVVAGKYRFDIGTARGPDGLLKLAEHLIGLERRALKKN